MSKIETLYRIVRLLGGLHCYSCLCECFDSGTVKEAMYLKNQYTSLERVCGAKDLQ